MSYAIRYATNTHDLENMLTLRRPARSKTEKRLIRNFIDTLPAIQSDGYGNRYVRIGAPNLLWSCHTDTVHRQAGDQSIIKQGDFISLSPNETNSSCLGADCSTGVWLMSQMIERNIPGLYVFHRDEEIGGHGSEYIARHNPALLAGINAAIAFDRKGYDSVITHQSSDRCASDTFAKSLAAHLPGDYAPDDSGLFTDTANYTDIIGECSNISIGYLDAHSAKEKQDLRFAKMLLEALCDLDQTTLTFERKPGEREIYSNRFSRSYGASAFLDDWGDFVGSNYKKDNREELKRLCRDYPEEVAAYLDGDLGIDHRDIEDFINYLGR